MEIPAKLVIRKMEEELVRLKQSLDRSDAGSGSSASPASYREHAQALKTYCDLLLDSEGSSLQSPGKVQRASMEDMTAIMSEGLDDTKSGQKQSTAVTKGKNPTQGKTSRSKGNEPIYDEGNEPDSDSLFDF
ncbi:DUF5327 family protein [Salipaludibacillus daqingensis]|uniref:DUF5327 family protein n=1 Tax=Salipaludibacillus daqingensis TaxID=3041001 RepID=UPI002474BD89|nr:DUF5327 family protein [Salipaludibacillus daqingensis]